MGAGASIPDSLDEAAAKELAGEKWDKARFDSLQKEGTITSEQLLAAAANASTEAPKEGDGPFSIHIKSDADKTLVKPKRRGSVVQVIENTVVDETATVAAAPDVKPTRRGSVVQVDAEEVLDEDEQAVEAPNADGPPAGVNLERRGSQRRQSVVDNPMMKARTSLIAGTEAEDGDAKSGSASSPATAGTIEEKDYMFSLFIGFVTWQIKVYDDENNVWRDGRATKYTAHSNEIGIEVGDMVAECELEFHFIELLSCEDDRSLNIFEHLAAKQDAFKKSQQASGTAPTTKKEASPPHITDDVPGTQRVPDLRRSSLIGTGLTGFVKLVQDIKTGHMVALKVLAKRKVEKLKQKANVMREKTAMEDIGDFPFCVGLISTCQTKFCLYMVQELVPGGELFHLLHPDGAEVKLPADSARFYAGCVLATLEHIHNKGWIYRDLKPENMLIDSEGYLKVCDFGFCKKLEKGEQCKSFLGTPEYMAPEIVKRQGYDHAADYWALGCLIHEMMGGCSPTQASSMQKTFKLIVEKDFSSFSTEIFEPDVQDLMKNLLVRDPRGRLGGEAAKKHEWFASMNFDELVAKKVKAPWIPAIAKDGDLSHFDLYDESEARVDPYFADSSWSDGF